MCIRYTNNNFSYKNFDLNVYIIARWGQMIDYELAGAYVPQGKGNFPAKPDISYTLWFLLSSTAFIGCGKNVKPAICYTFARITLAAAGMKWFCP